LISRINRLSARVVLALFMGLGASLAPITAVSQDQLRQAPPALQPDERFKVDILLIVAHPDDETVVSTYLAKAIFDQGKRVGAIVATRGDAGGNAMGYEQAAALGAVREIEARRALAFLGINNVWFLNGRDTASQSVLQSLENWQHGPALEQTVRLIRLTRPEVVLTWLPATLAGENHGDHQAAAVIATEAFDMAADPTAFPSQVAPPRDRRGNANLMEGLRPWQPRKLYFFTDAFTTDFMKGKGPEYSITEVSPSRKVPYLRIAVQGLGYHLTQIGSRSVREALIRGDVDEAINLFKQSNEGWFTNPLRLMLGKSIVTTEAAADVFEGVNQGPVATVSKPSPQPRRSGPLSLELGGSWTFYHDFWRAHGIEQIADVLPPEASVRPGTTLRLPLLLRNDSAAPREYTLIPASTLPDGWTEQTGSAVYPVAAASVYPVEVLLSVPSKESREWTDIAYEAKVEGRSIGKILIRVQVRMNTMPQ
jgi:LmbE family N-acetylglucosaminyl deacetylase